MYLRKILVIKIVSVLYFYIIITNSFSENMHNIAISGAELTETLSAHKEKLVRLERKKAQLRRLDPKGEYRIAAENGNESSFFATTTKEFIGDVALLAKEIYLAGKTNKNKLAYRIKSIKIKFQKQMLFWQKKRNDSFNLREKSLKNEISSDEFKAEIMNLFGSILQQVKFPAEIMGSKEQLNMLDSLNLLIGQKIEEAEKAYYSKDIFGLYIQKIPGIVQKFSNYTVLKTFDSDNGNNFRGCILFSEKNNHLIFAFPETTHDKDWHKSDKLTEVANEFGSAQKMKFNKGLIQSYKEIQKELVAFVEVWLEEYKRRGTSKVLELTFTGQSKGAALSTLSAFDIAHIVHKNLGPQMGVIPWKINNPTFASPRVAGNETVKIIEERLGKYNILRFINQDDRDSSIVEELRGQKHVGLALVFNKSRFLGDLTAPRNPFNFQNLSIYTENAPRIFERTRKLGAQQVIVDQKIEAVQKEIDKLQVKS